MDALPYIVQVAFFGAAGTSFVLAHLKNVAATGMGQSEEPAKRWRIFRHPHKRADESPAALALRRAAAMQTAWGFAFLGGALIAPPVFRLLHIGA
jgi:hypothetical protein